MGLGLGRDRVFTTPAGFAISQRGHSGGEVRWLRG